MHGIMKSLIQRIIDLLKKRVRENLETINQNQSTIGGLLKQAFSPERTYQLDKFYTLNNELLKENNDYINLQLVLLKFLEKYKDMPAINDPADDESSESDSMALLDDKEIFDLTVEGRLSFESGHPRYNDEDFFNRLLNYYTAREAYEKCHTLLSLKNSQKAG
jgi:hypothetical protein